LASLATAIPTWMSPLAMSAARTWTALSIPQPPFWMSKARVRRPWNSTLMPRRRWM
jgi:hypothetical protein